MNASDDRLNRVLKAVCALLIVFIASNLAIQIASLPRYYERVTTGTVPTLIVAGDTPEISNELVAEWAAERGLSLPAYALYSIALNLAITLGFAAVAGLILWKARREWFHWFTALILLFYPSGGLWQFTQVSQIGYNYIALAGVLWPGFFVFLYLFPNGRAVPRWTRWLIGPLAVLHLVIQTFGLAGELGWLPAEVVEPFFNLFPVVLAALPLIILCQVYRYLRRSTLEERAQIKWFVVGLAAYIIASGFLDPNASEVVYGGGFRGDASNFLALVIPASIGLAILRYRLYDIDLIIRRTLIYGVLTGLLGLVYLGCVVLLQRLFPTGTSQIAVVISTLVIAALFAPLRRRVQRAIDRRFYRRRYNAQETLTEFSARLRAADNADLDRLAGQLVGVIEETMQPAHLSLGLKEIPVRSGGRPGEQKLY